MLTSNLMCNKATEIEAFYTYRKNGHYPAQIRKRSKSTEEGMINKY